ncbi:MAG: hypothetical protein ACREBK_00055 [Sphingomicrobium sp.]
MMLRLLNPQGIAGIVAALILAMLLVAAKIDARHWRKQSAQFEQLYRGSEQAHSGTIANYHAAAAAAEAADRAAANRVGAVQRTINERSADALDTRLADARVRARRLRLEARAAGSNPGRGPPAHLPGLPAAAAGAAEASGEAGFPAEDRLIATEQAIQLDELIKWVRLQGDVDINE